MSNIPPANETIVSELIHIADRLDTAELELLIKSLLQKLQAEKGHTNLDEIESEFIKTLNEGLPPDMIKRFEKLIKKRDREEIKESELLELAAINNQIEEYQANMLHVANNLAKHKGVSLRTLFTQLGIEWRRYAGENHSQT